MNMATADLMDRDADGLESCETQFRQFGGARSFSGRIRTVECFEDNVLLRRVLSEPGDGQVLVVDGGASYRTALMGDLVAKSAVANGWVGVVINGCVRDVVEIGRLPLGIKALGSNPRRSNKAEVGRIDVPVTFGGATFIPGATLVSDEDGIVVTQSAPS
ncbi:MAG: ribonuclease E activity regulator RraA [Chloroflexota bacterium]